MNGLRPRHLESKPGRALEELLRTEFDYVRSKQLCRMMHALSFRVMRLSKTAFQPTSNLLVDTDTDFCSDVEAAAALQRRQASSKLASPGRAELASPLDVCNIQGILELPTSFGVLYLGEAFQSYMSVSNISKAVVTAVQCKVELETSRGKVLLYDNSANKASLQPNGRQDFIVRHDVKEVGQHTLICSVSYVTAEGERRFLPQYFKFTSSNPLSVRTKSRMVHSSILLEACIENTSRATLVLEQVRFDPTPRLTVHSIQAAPNGDTVADPALKDYVKSLQVISPSGGAMNLLYRLEANGQSGECRRPEGPGGILGKLDIRWRTTLGEMGRLQTQPIVASAAAARDYELQASDIPASVPVETPFSITVRLCSNVERRTRDLAVSCMLEEGGGKVVQLGPACVSVPDLAALGSAGVSLQFLALERGIQRLPDLALLEPVNATVLDVLSLCVRVE